MTTIINGLLGGAVVALVATLAARLVGGGGKSASRWRSYLSAVVYGSAAGGALVALELFVLGVLAVPPSISEAVTVSVAWSVVLLSVSLVVWRFVHGAESERANRRQLVAYHVVFGFSLGVWIRMTWIT